MTESIRRQLVVPPYVSAIHMALGLCMLAAGIALVAESRASAPSAAAPEIDLAVPAPPAPVKEVAVATEIQPIADEIHLLIRAGGASYMKLAGLDRDGERRWPAHGRPRLLTEDGVHLTIAEVALPSVPPAHRAWAGQPVIVDGACRATVVGFAVVSQLVGDPGYAGVEKDAWDVASVAASGTAVLAARLDGCAGTYARDAALPPVIVPAPVIDARLAAAGQRALIASAVGAETARQWAEQTAEQAPERTWWKETTFKTQVVRHPRTGATFVAVHGSTEFGCGAPNVNVWGLYRVGADGALSPVREQKLELLHSIDQLIDVEGDGELELIGKPWLGLGVMLTDAAGGAIDQIDLPFYGCPC